MKNLKSGIVYLLIVVCFIGCKKNILDQPPKDKLTDASVWSDLKLATLYLNQAYNGVPSGFERGYYLLASATDEAKTHFGFAYAQYWNRGDFSPSDEPRFDVPWGNTPNPWANQYLFIRKVNVFLQKIDAVPGDDSVKKVLKGEALFLRGLFYHELVRLYGGVPLIDKPQSLANIDSLLVKRNTVEECNAFIVSDLDAAAAILPDKRSGADVGRASRGAALALKGRQLLYAEKWAESAAASKQAMAIPGYSLFPNYEQMFWAVNNNNSEVYFSKNYIPKLAVHPSNQFNSLYTMGGWGGTQPTQNLVDEYEMTDGLSYNASPLYDPNQPYKNRDPRFGASILYDGCTWNGREIELKEGGKDGIGTANDATKTGYNLRKLMDPAVIPRPELPNEQRDPNNGYNNWIVIRLGEVLLNYAEAQNEAVGPDQSVYDAVNAIRNRPSVNMPSLPAGLTQSQMRDKIRHERTIELAFEEQRFFDLRRWKGADGKYLAETILNSPVYGLKTSNDRTTRTRFKVEDRVYLPKHRLLPVPQSEINIDKNLVQNPGW
jgi:hypothetical protein